jgi:sugar-specific transcriptional regulator TrmB
VGVRDQERAPRGANLAAVVAALRERGRATVPELAEATKVKLGVLYALTRILVDKGALTTEKTNGSRTFALPE